MAPTPLHATDPAPTDPQRRHSARQHVHLLQRAAFAIALAALAIHGKAVFPPIDPENETNAEAAPQAVLATAIGYHRFEGVALVEAP